jgi:hypothetical protein
MGVGLLAILSKKEGAVQSGPIVDVEMTGTLPRFERSSPILIQEPAQAFEFRLRGGDEPSETGFVVYPLNLLKIRSGLAGLFFGNLQ